MVFQTYHNTSGTYLESVEQIEDLGGVTITNDLSWSQHVAVTVNKASKVLRTIKRTVAVVVAIKLGLLFYTILSVKKASLTNSNSCCYSLYDDIPQDIKNTHCTAS